MKLGSRLADRYLVEASAPFAVAGADAWVARDERLNRDVTVLVVSDSGASFADDAAQRARVVRDPRLARIIEVGRIESDDVAIGDRPFIAIERPQGVVVADLFSRRIVPVAVARAIVGEAATSVAAAAALGLNHGALDAAWLTITSRGKVVVGGAGVMATLTSVRSDLRLATERQDARALAGLFARAITGVRPRAVTPALLPRGLTASERALVAATSKGGGPTTLAEVLAAVAPWDASLLRGLSLREVTFVPHPDAPRPVPKPIAPSVVTAPAEAAAAAPATTAAPERDVIETGEDDEWSLDQLEVLDDLEPAPSIFEALLALLHRRFPRATLVTRLLERVHARATGGPRLHAQRWMLAAGLIAVVVFMMIAIRGVTAPGAERPTPTPHQYPDFTFGPPATPSPGT